MLKQMACVTWADVKSDERPRSTHAHILSVEIHEREVRCQRWRGRECIE